jgi:hypothetical protein
VAERLIDAAATRSRREGFYGDGTARERLAAGLIEGVGTADQADLDAVREHLRKVPQPFLDLLERSDVRVLVAHTSILEAYPELGTGAPAGAPPGFKNNNLRSAHNLTAREIVVSTTTPRSRTVVLPKPGALLLREVGFMVDALLGGLHGRRSAQDQRWQEARKSEAGLPEWLKSDALDAELYAEVFARYFGGEKTMRTAWPTVFAAFEASYDLLIAEEEKRTHPIRLKRITKFMRAHVLTNPALGQPARLFVADCAASGVPGTADFERHIKGVKLAGGRLLIDTKWGEVPYIFAEYPHDRPAEKARAEAFFEKFVQSAPRMSAPTKASLKTRMLDEYGPWRAEQFDQVKSVFESRGRVMIKTASGDIIL